MSFDKIFDLTAGVYFNFYNICIYVSIRWTIKSWPRLMGSRRSAFQNENQIIKFRRFGGEGAPPPSIRAYSGRQKSVSYSAATGARCVVLALLEPMYCTISYYIILYHTINTSYIISHSDKTEVWARSCHGASTHQAHGSRASYACVPTGAATCNAVRQQNSRQGTPLQQPSTIRHSFALKPDNFCTAPQTMPRYFQVMYPPINLNAALNGSPYVDHTPWAQRGVPIRPG